MEDFWWINQIYYAYFSLCNVRPVRVVFVAILARLTWRSADERVAERTDETEKSNLYAFWKFTSRIRGVRRCKRTKEELNQRFSIYVWTLQELEKAEKWMDGAAGPSGKSHAMLNWVCHGIHQMNVWLHGARCCFCHQPITNCIPQSQPSCNHVRLLWHPNLGSWNER